MSTNILSAVISQGVLPLYFHNSEEVSIKVMQALYDAGIRVVEYTNRGPEALNNFKKMKAAAADRMPGMMLALGTVLDAATAIAAVDAGADLLISPGFGSDIQKYTSDNNITWIPGCMTATDIMQARSADIKMVKLFPGNLLGPDFMKAIKDLFPDMSFMPTGGVTAEKANLSAWFSAGVAAVGMGSTLITKSFLQNGDYASITTAARDALALVATVRNDRK